MSRSCPLHVVLRLVTFTLVTFTAVATFTVATCCFFTAVATFTIVTCCFFTAVATFTLVTCCFSYCSCKFHTCYLLLFLLRLQLSQLLLVAFFTAVGTFTIVTCSFFYCVCNLHLLLSQFVTFTTPGTPSRDPINYNVTYATHVYTCSAIHTSKIYI